MCLSHRWVHLKVIDLALKKYRGRAFQFWPIRSLEAGISTLKDEKYWTNWKAMTLLRPIRKLRLHSKPPLRNQERQGEHRNHSHHQLPWNRSHGSHKTSVVIHPDLIDVYRIHYPTTAQYTLVSNLQGIFWWAGGGWVWPCLRERNSCWLSLRWDPHTLWFLPLPCCQGEDPRTILSCFLQEEEKCSHFEIWPECPL